MDIIDMIESKAREVNDIYWEGSPNPLSSLYAYSVADQHRMKRLARYILVRELKIRLDEIHQPATLERIARIERQIKQLEEK